MKFYLDDDISHRIAALARDRGLDVVAASDVGMASSSDANHLTFAAAAGRCLVSRDKGLDRLSVHFAGQGLTARRRIAHHVERAVSARG